MQRTGLYHLGTPQFFFISFIQLSKQTVLFHYICMDCTFANPKPLCRLSHGRVFVYDVIGNLDCPLFDIFFHGVAPGCFLQNMIPIPQIYLCVSKRRTHVKIGKSLLESADFYIIFIHSSYSV